MTARKMSCVISILICFSFSHGKAEQGPDAPGQPKKRPATLKRVVDGDTLVVVLENGKEERIRLLCVNTEESVHPDKKQNTEFGKKTSEHLKKLLPAGTPLRIEIEKGNEKDKYERLLAYAFFMLGDTGQAMGPEEVKKSGWKEEQAMNLNLLLVVNGYSPYYTPYGKSEKYHEDFMEEEKAARKAKRGIWSTEESTKKYLRLKSKWGQRAAALEKKEKKPVPEYHDEHETEKPEKPEPGADKENDTLTLIAIDADMTDGASAHIDLGPLPEGGRSATFVLVGNKAYTFVASKKSTKFHKATCKWVKKIKPENAVGYSTREEAVKDGKEPCKECRP